MANGFRVANREYVCDHCSYTIRIGSKYVRTTNISENGVKLEKRHDYCFTAYMEAKEMTRKDVGNKRNFFDALDKVAEQRSKLVGVLTDLVTALEERDTKEKPLSSQELELLTSARKIIAQLQ